MSTPICQRSISDFHPEDIKAAIRKKYRTISAFHEAHGLPETGLYDVLRGRRSAKVEAAVMNVLGAHQVANEGEASICVTSHTPETPTVFSKFKSIINRSLRAKRSDFIV